MRSVSVTAGISSSTAQTQNSRMSQRSAADWTSDTHPLTAPHPTHSEHSRSINSPHRLSQCCQPHASLPAVSATISTCEFSTWLSSCGTKPVVVAGLLVDCGCFSCLPPIARRTKNRQNRQMSRAPTTLPITIAGDGPSAQPAAATTAAVIGASRAEACGDGAIVAAARAQQAARVVRGAAVLAEVEHGRT